MTFFSKCTTLTMVVRPSTTIVHLNGIPQNVPGKYIRFEDGMFKTSDEEEIKFLMSNPALGRDYVADESDPYFATRKSMEPDHSIEVMQFGHAVQQLNPKRDPLQELQAKVAEQAGRMAREMVREMIRTGALVAPEAKQGAAAADKPKPGRPPTKKSHHASKPAAEPDPFEGDGGMPSDGPSA